MLNSDRHEHPVPEFSAALSTDVISAPATFLSGSTPVSEARLNDIARRVCTEAHAGSISLDVMLLRMEELLRRVPRFSGDSNQRALAFDHILSACRGAYES